MATFNHFLLFSKERLNEFENEQFTSSFAIEGVALNEVFFNKGDFGIQVCDVNRTNCKIISESPEITGDYYYYMDSDSIIAIKETA